MSETTEEQSIFSLISNLPSPTKITDPISLVAYLSLGMIILDIIILQFYPSAVLGVLSLVLFCLLSGLIIMNYEKIAKTHLLRTQYATMVSNYTELAELAEEGNKWRSYTGIMNFPESPDGLPPNMKMHNPSHLLLWNDRLKPALELLEYEINDSAQKTIIGETYYYAEASKDDRRVAIISLDEKFFLYGEQWRATKWISSIRQLTDANSFIIVSDVRIICDEALHEKEDLSTNDITVLFICRSLKEWFIKGNIELTSKYIESRI